MIPKASDKQLFSNVTNESTFTINASPEAFRILSAGIYTNQIRAIIRELSCNAYDAHVMAGTPDRPFVVHLPDEWEPTFSIEDFGVGLDHDDIQTIYTVYFASNKTKSNSLIGGKGLGSKTPFSYTDAFTVRSRKDGVERHYSAHFGTNGAPAISLLAESATTEGNGVKITVPVKPNDFYRFRNEASSVFSFFRVLPEINIVQLDNSKITDLDAAGGFLISSRLQRNTVTVVMGAVAYVVDIEGSGIAADLSSETLGILKNTGMMIHFEIGELDVAASREAVSFDGPTKTAFVKRVDDLGKSVIDRGQTEVEEAGTVIEAITMTKDALGPWGLNYINYRDESLYDWSVTDIIEDLSCAIELDETCDELFQYHRAKHGRRRTSKYRKDWFSCISYDSATDIQFAFVEVDVDPKKSRGLDKATRTLINQTDTTVVFTLNRRLTQSEVDGVVDILHDNVEFFTLTELRDKYKNILNPPRQVRIKEPTTALPRAKKNQIRVKMWSRGDQPVNGEPAIAQIVDVDDIINDRVVYSVCGSNKPLGYVLGSNVSRNSHSFALFARIFDIDRIIILTQGQVNKFTSMVPNAVEVGALGNSDIKDHDIGMFAALSEYVGIERVDADTNEYIRSYFVERFKGESSGSIRRMVFDDYKSIQTNKELQFIDGLIQLTSRVVPTMVYPEGVKLTHKGWYPKYWTSILRSMVSEVDNHIVECSKEFLENYPMFKLLRRYDAQGNEETLQEYVRLVDASK